MIKSISLLLVTYCLCTIFSFQAIAQPIWKADSIPLFRFLQKNYDSTIVCHIGTGIEPNYNVVSKCTYETSIVVNFFSYRANYRAAYRVQCPDEVFTWLFSMKHDFERTLPDTNRYLDPVDIQARLKIWDTLQRFDLWNLKDDITITSPQKCASEVYDGEFVIYYLITKDSIRERYYYSPRDYAACDPEDKNRRTAVKAADYFSSIFKREQRMY